MGNEFDEIMTGSFGDPLVLSLAETAETFKKGIDSAAEIFVYASELGLPEALSSEMTMTYLDLIVGAPEGE